MTNSADSDQLAVDLHCFQRQGVSRFSRTRVKISQSLMAAFVKIHVEDNEKDRDLSPCARKICYLVDNIALEEQ